jgi:uncharacterized membrane protein YhhN
MNPMIFVILCFVCVAGLVSAERKDRDDLRRLFKPAASICFVLAGVAAGGLGGGFGQTIVTGLVYCAIGDILLVPKSGRWFLAGMTAFALGHAAYIAAFLTGGYLVTPAVTGGALAAAAFSGGLVLWLWRDLGRFRLPVIGYSIIISAMVAASIAHWAAHPSPASATLILAAAGFALSDLSVARDRFRKPEFINRLWGLPLYYAAQCLFAVSI